MWLYCCSLFECLGKKGVYCEKLLVSFWHEKWTQRTVLLSDYLIKKNAKPDIQLIDQTRRKWPGCQIQRMQHSGNYITGAGLLKAELSENKESEFWMSNEDYKNSGGHEWLATSDSFTHSLSPHMNAWPIHWHMSLVNSLPVRGVNTGLTQ